MNELNGDLVMSEWMPVLVAQAWQVTLLIVAVAAINRWAGKSRPHLAHALWLVVLVKCVTPPVWSSPSGLFCWLQPARETMREQLAVEPPSQDWSELAATARHSQSVDVALHEDAWVESDVGPEEWLIGLGENGNPVTVLPLPITTDKVDWSRVLLGAWALASLVVIAVAVIRWLRCWRMLRNAPQRECSELSEQLDSLARRLKLRRRVRLIVTESRLGPAVIGLFRTTVLLPALIVDRLAQRSPVAPRQESRTSFDSDSSDTSEGQPLEGISVAEQQSCRSPLAPILAHELLHIRRGDLWVGLLQTLAQAVWWCHPLVWWVNRRTTREAERCCDEEVLAELGCDPAAYARALVDVLELKRELKPVPVFPGVRPVEVTSQRLERIMQLGQGCQRRTPWWCWLLAALAAAASWPGAAFVVTAEDTNAGTKSETGERGGVSPPVSATPSPNRGSDASPLARRSKPPRGPDGQSLEPHTFLNYDAIVISGAEAEIRQLAKQVNDKLMATNGAPVIVESDALSRLLKDAQSVPRINLVSHRADSLHVGDRVSVGDTADIVFPTTVTSPDAPAQFIETSREFGWTLTIEPVFVRNEALRLRVVHWQGHRDHQEKVIARHPKTGEEYEVPGINERQADTSVELRDGQSLVFPVSKVPLASPKNFMLLTLQVRRSEQPGTATKAEQRQVVGVGVNSDSGVTGEVVSDDSDDLFGVGDITEIRVEGNKLVPTEEILAMIESKVGKSAYEKQMRADVRAIYASRRFYSVEPRLVRADKGVILLFRVIERPKVTVGSKEQAENLQLDGSGQLHWEHPMQRGLWSVSVQPDPGRKLIASDESSTKFHSDGRVLLGLTRAEKVLMGYELSGWIRINADEFNLQSSESGQQIRLGGNVLFSGHEFEASCDSLLLNLDRRSESDRFEPAPTAVLRGNVVIRQSKSAEPSELKADRVALCINGSAISRIHRDDNGLVVVLRDPAVQDQRLHRKGQKALAKEMLGNLVSVNVENVPLKEVLKKLNQWPGRKIVLDNPGLEEESLSEETPVTMAVHQLKLSSALTLLLEPLRLGYRVEESGVIVVTSQQRLKGKPVVVTYAVADLVTPIPKRGTINLTADRSVAGEESKPSEPAKSMQPQLPELVKLIMSTCQPNSWAEVGGVGSIKAHDSTLSLVVRQTQDVHDEIRGLLESLRRQLDIQASLHVETLTVPADFWHKVGKDFDVPEVDGLPIPQPQVKAAPRSIARLTKKEAALLRSLCRPESAPKVTLLNGQELDVLFGDKTPTMRLGLKPVVSADHQKLRLQAAATKPDAELDFTKLAAITLESGHSLLLDVTEVYSAGPTAAVPTLLKVFGQEDRLYRVTRQSERRTLLLITGTVVIVEEEESLLGIPN